MIVYRLESKTGEGLFCTRDGVLKTNPSVVFNDNGLYAFINPNKFTEPSYIEFLESDNYLLYKYVLLKSIYISRYGETTFDEKDVIEKKLVDKAICIGKHTKSKEVL